MSGLSASLWMFSYVRICVPMYEYSAGPPMNGLSVSLWMCSYV